MPRVLRVLIPDKVEHVVAYGLMAGFFLLSFKRPVRPQLLLTGLVTLAVIGALDEATQPLVDRTCALGGDAGDLTGIAVARVISLVIKLLRLCTVLA